jgi:hypothetical protein
VQLDYSHLGAEEVLKVRPTPRLGVGPVAEGGAGRGVVGQSKRAIGIHGDEHWLAMLV